jgi:hypothetical protein
MSRSFLVLFFKKERLACLLLWGDVGGGMAARFRIAAPLRGSQ